MVQRFLSITLIIFWHTLWRSTTNCYHDFHWKIYNFSVKSTFLLKLEVTKELIWRNFFSVIAIYCTFSNWFDEYFEKYSNFEAGILSFCLWSRLYSKIDSESTRSNSNIFDSLQLTLEQWTLVICNANMGIDLHYRVFYWILTDLAKLQ